MAKMFIIRDKETKEFIDGTCAVSEKEAVGWFLNKFTVSEFQKWEFWEPTTEIVKVHVGEIFEDTQGEFNAQ